MLLGAEAEHGQLDTAAAARLARIASTAHYRLRYEEGAPSGFGPAEPIFDGAIGSTPAAYVVARAMAH